MPKISICTNDVTKDIKSKVQYIQLPKMDFSVEYEVDKDLLKEIETDGILASKVFKETGAIYKKSKATLEDICIKADKSVQSRPGDKVKILKALETDVRNQLEGAGKQMEKVCEKQIDAWLKTKNDKKKYRRKVNVGIALGAFSVVAGAGLTIGSAVMGGAPGVVGLVGLAKSIGGLAAKIKDEARSMENAEKNLVSGLGKAMEDYNKNSRGQVATKEIAKSAVATVAVYQPAGISKVESQFVTFTGKLRETEVKLSSCSKDIHKLLDQQTSVNQKFVAKLEKELAQRNYTSKRLPKLKEQIKKLEKLTDSQIKATTKMNAEVEKSKKREKVYGDLFKQLKAKRPNWVGYAEDAIKVGTGAGMIIAGVASDFSGTATDIIGLCTDIEGVATDFMAEKML